jgi:sigma-E factor negative regulatory protein RseA
MFDGELPAAECELLSRRIDRDEALRARWARYALIGAAMRFEPVATARSDFAARVSTAVDRLATASRSEARTTRRRHLLWQGALAATLVGAVAGLSIVMLRNVALDPVGAPTLAATHPGAVSAHATLASLAVSGAALLARQREALDVLGSASAPARAPATKRSGASREPWSYVTPSGSSIDNSALRTELVDYIVAHSAYSTPLMRPDLLSTLISGEENADTAAALAPAPQAGGVIDATTTAAGQTSALHPVGAGDNATTAASAASR